MSRCRARGRDPCTGACSSPTGSQQARRLPLGLALQSNEKAGREARPEKQSERSGYWTVLDQAAVSPDSKPSVKIDTTLNAAMPVCQEPAFG